MAPRSKSVPFSPACSHAPHLSSTTAIWHRDHTPASLPAVDSTNYSVDNHEILCLFAAYVFDLGIDAESLAS